MHANLPRPAASSCCLRRRLAAARSRRGGVCPKCNRALTSGVDCMHSVSLLIPLWWWSAICSTSTCAISPATIMFTDVPAAVNSQLLARSTLLVKPDDPSLRFSGRSIVYPNGSRSFDWAAQTIIVSITGMHEK